MLKTKSLSKSQWLFLDNGIGINILMHIFFLCIHIYIYTNNLEY